DTTVDAAGNWTVNVAGGDLANDTEFEVVVSSSDAAGNTVESSATSTHTVDTSPAASPTAVTGTEDTAITLSWANFGITDIDSAGSDLSVIITQLPAAGSLHFEQAPGTWVAVTLNQEVSHADIEAGKLRFEPAADESGIDAYGGNEVGDQQADYAQIKFKPTDGVNEGSEATLVIDITPVADAPTLNLAGSSVLAAADFENVALNGANHSGAIDASSLNNGLGGVWQTDNVDEQVEVGQQETYLNDGSTNKVIELERNAGDASNLYTEITGTAGSTYSLDFDYSPRSGALNNSTIEVFWGGNLIGTLSAEAVGFTSHHYDLPILTDGTYRLEFRALDSNSTGGLLDNIVLTDVRNAGNEDTSIRLSSITAELTDTDDSETLQVSIGNIPSGAILTDNSGNSFKASDANGNLVDITNWDKSTLSILPPPDFNGTIALNVIATATETANGDQRSTTSTLNVTVNPVNDAPVNTLPTDYTTNEDTALTLSGLSVTDVDAASAAISVTLTVTRGAITAADASGVTVSGSGSDSVVLSGTLAEINAYLADTATQPTYVPAADDSGTVTLTMTSNDLGNTGAGGALSDTDISIIHIAPVADAVPASDVSLLIGSPSTSSLTSSNGPALLDGQSEVTLGSGIVVKASSGVFNWSGGNNLGVNANDSTGTDRQRIGDDEAITFDFPAGMQFMQLNLKNSADDTVQISSTLEPEDLAGKASLNGSILSTATSQPDYSKALKITLNLEVSNVVNGVTETTSISRIADVNANGTWSVNLTSISGTITQATLVSLIDGALLSQGGTDSVQYKLDSDMSSLTIGLGAASEFPASNGAPKANNGFQIEFIDFSTNADGTTDYTYPVDLHAVIQDTVGAPELFNSLSLSDLPTGSIISVRHADGSYEEIIPNDQGEYDLSAYTSLLNTPTDVSGTDEVYLITSSPLPNGFAPTLTLEVVDGSSVAKTIIGGTDGSTLAGGEGNDYLDGGAGNDILIGGAGDDILLGGSGNDTLTGGAGADSFVWRAGDTGDDKITDFNIGEGDRIDLSDLLQGENDTNIDNYLQVVTTGTETVLQVSSTGQLNAGGAADVTINLENGGAPVDLSSYGSTSSQIVSSLIAGDLIKIDHT
ncbi:MAG: type I secretion C-terminal target domain-containing protein, partial [Pseudomonas sp.]|nr:type I secretion C-terminal target domain-containing protein [Pseudomonas sp.]